MTDFTRYGIYYVPAGELADFGARWLGWDLRSCERIEQGDLPGLGPRQAEVTERPRKYGFHATLKPPFALAEGRGEAELTEAFADLAARLAPVAIERLKPTRLGRFLALVPEGASDGLRALAGACVRELDPFRAAPGEAELLRRRTRGLTPQQEAHLARWGYPYVMEEFRFHITLTGPLGPQEAAAAEQALAEALPPLPEPFVLGAVSLVGERPDGMFQEIRRHALGGSTATLPEATRDQG